MKIPVDYTTHMLDTKFPETSIRLIDTRVVLRMAHWYCLKAADELNIPMKRISGIAEWIVLEIYDHKLRQRDLRIEGHYADDDGKTILKSLEIRDRETLDRCIESEVRSICRGAARVTAMISGSTLIISKELKEGGR